jgi:hypothetical protein
MSSNQRVNTTTTHVPDDDVGSSTSLQSNKKMREDTSNTNLQSLVYTNVDGITPKLQVLDQLLIPHQKVYIDIPTIEMAYTVIQTMQIRGMCVCTFDCVGLAFCVCVCVFVFVCLFHCAIVIV